MFSAPAPNVQVYHVQHPAPNQAYAPNPNNHMYSPGVQLGPAPPPYTPVAQAVPLQAGNPSRPYMAPGPVQTREAGGVGAMFVGDNDVQQQDLSMPEDFSTPEEMDQTDFSAELTEPSAPSFEEY